MKKSKISSWDYLWYALYAFAGLGLEIMLLSVIEPMIFGNINSSDYTVTQNSIHWILTIICWSALSIFLVNRAKKKLDFNILDKSKPTTKGLIIAIILIIACILINAFDWKTLKIIGEFKQNEFILFIFQYIYYIFEVGLVFLIVAFGQKFAESLLKRKSNIPFGGIVLCCTWGAIHILSKGSFYTGLGVMAFALLYGCMYLLLNRNAKYSYLAMALAFMI